MSCTRLLCALWIGAAGCGQQPGAVASSADAGPAAAFADATAESGLADFRQQNGDPEKAKIADCIGAGVAFIDFDLDGWIDVYLPDGASAGARAAARDRLFRNTGGRFSDASDLVPSEPAGRWAMGASVADLTGNGYPDVYLVCHGANGLLANEAGLRFGALECGLEDERWSTSACLLDADKDGDLDVYVANYVDYDPAFVPEDPLTYHGIEVAYGPRGLPGARDGWYVNADDGSFVESSAAAGLADASSFAFQAVALDHDQDGSLDIFVGNDSMPNYLWHNDGRGHFTNRASEVGLAVSRDGTPQACMGVAVGDYDRDLVSDLYVTNFSDDYHILYQGDASGLFDDATRRAGLVRPTLDRLGWGCVFADLDDDGHVDLVAANGHVYPQVDRFDLGTSYRQVNQLFWNDGAGRFVEGRAAPGSAFAVRESSRGLAVADYDNDGDLDLLFGNIDAPPTLCRNEGERAGSWTKLRLIGAGRNTSAFGARVELVAGGTTYAVTAGENSSFASAHDPRIHVGVGEAERIETMRIRWPDGELQSFEDLPLERLLVIEQGAEAVDAGPLP